MNSLPLLASVCIGITTFFLIFRIGPFVDAIGDSYTSHLVARMAELGVRQEQRNWMMRIWGGSLILVPLAIAVLFQMYPVAVAFGYLIFVSPRMYFAYVIEQRETLLRDQMVTATSSLASSVKANLRLRDALKRASESVADPLKTELETIVEKLDLRMSEEDALRETAERLKIESFSLFSAAACVCLKQGGDLSEPLERVNLSLQDIQRIERKITADTAAGRKAVNFLMFVPIGAFLFYFMFYRDGAMLLLTDVRGHFVLCGVMLLTFYSIRLCDRIVRIDV